MSTSSLNLSRQYTSFSGSDIRVVVEGQTIGAMQAISYAIQREKAPIYVMGSPDPKSFSRGKRGIAGTIITLMFDQHVMNELAFRDMRFVADKDEILSINDNPLDATSTDDLGTIGDGGPVFDANDLSTAYTIAKAWYVDQLPPFDAIIIAANEYGQAASMRIYGIEILNEGSGYSVDDQVIDNQMTYVARTIAPWRRLGSFNFSNGGFDPPTAL